MKLFLCILASSTWLLAAVDGTVINGTTGKPEPSVIVTAMQPGESGMQTIQSVKSDAEGKFKIDKPYGPGPLILQGLFDGVTYNQALVPGSPTSGVSLRVYNSSAKPGIARVAEHMVLIEPSAKNLAISETFLNTNDSTTTFRDEAKGSVQFYLPEGASGGAQVTITAPGGVPIQRPAEKTGKPGVFKITYPLKPGETRFDISYSLPPGDTFSGKSLDPAAPVRLVTPPAVTLAGDGLDSLGQEPQTQAHIYSVRTPAFEAKIEGTGSLRRSDAAPEEENDQPQPERAPARIYSRFGWVIALTLGILAIGGTMLYRKGAA